MAPAATTSSSPSSVVSNPGRWLQGTVKGVVSGDTLVIYSSSSKSQLPAEMTITLSGIIAPSPKLARGEAFTFAWQSRRYLMDLCLGKGVVFMRDYFDGLTQRNFGSVYLNGDNLSQRMLARGWAREAPLNMSERSKVEKYAEEKHYIMWSKGAPGKSIQERTNWNSQDLVNGMKGGRVRAFVEQVIDGTTLSVYLLPYYRIIRLFVKGVRAPPMGARPHQHGGKGVLAGETATTQKEECRDKTVRESPSNEHKEGFYAKLSKHSVELKILNREVEVVLEEHAKNNTFFGSIFYYDGDKEKDLAIELLRNGLAKLLENSGTNRRRLKEAELEAKKNGIRIWENYALRPSTLQVIKDDEFCGKVAEVVSGDCVVIVKDSSPSHGPTWERRVYLAGIRAPGIGHPLRSEAMEFLRTMVIGKHVNVMMEYSKQTAPKNGDKPRSLEFGSVFLPKHVKKNGDVESGEGSINVSEEIIQQGMGWVIRTKDLDEEPKFYADLLEAESIARYAKRGVYSPLQPSPNDVADVSHAPLWKAKAFANRLRESKRRYWAIVDYVLSGDTFKISMPEEGYAMTFSLSGIKCPDRSEAYGEEAFAFMRMNTMQRDVEVQIDYVDNKGTFFGAMWESKTNMAVAVLDEGLGKLVKSHNRGREDQVHVLGQAQENARKQNLKMWENYQEGKETFEVMVTENIGGGEFYVQFAKDEKILSQINRQLKRYGQKVPAVVGFHPEKGCRVLAQHSSDGLWHRAMIVDDATASLKKEFKVFYTDYGTEEIVPLSKIRPHDASVHAGEGLAHLCKLAYIKVPQLGDNLGRRAKEFLDNKFGKEGGVAEFTNKLNATVQERVISRKRELILVTLICTDRTKEVSINAALLEAGLASLRKDNIHKKDRKAAIERLSKHETRAKEQRLNLWGGD